MQSILFISALNLFASQLPKNELLSIWLQYFITYKKFSICVTTCDQYYKTFFAVIELP